MCSVMRLMATWFGSSLCINAGSYDLAHALAVGQFSSRIAALCSCLPGPGNNDVCMLPAGRDVGVERWLDEFGVLLDDAGHIPSPVHNVPLYPVTQFHHHIGKQHFFSRSAHNAAESPKHRGTTSHAAKHTLLALPLCMH
jgi:hypothetical protein